MLEVVTRIPAKVNLALKVIGKRSDGYHDIWSIMVPISVFDEVRLILDDGTSGVSVECNLEGVPPGENNLAVKAFKAYKNAAKWPDENKGVRIKLEKEIPVGAGLGGGSANAAAVILLLDRLNPRPLGDELLRSTAASVGADVPFFLQGQPCIAEGIGDRLTPLSKIEPYSLVLIKPPFTVSTAWAYGSLELTETDDFFMKKKVKEKGLNVPEALVNDLERVTLVRYPVLAEIKEWLKKKGAEGSLMSGSGPTVFGLFRNHEEALRVAGEAGQVWGKNYWIRAASIISEAYKT
ncbi:4-(cytidine 5'-diphospho)-2-C-methyl-D-erythritol kinase [Thermodesulforhabdus norvegica]|uniref:4-diphosphocytidyl-2-C-methyl-D-erythritol kinase n=1 Tax=Thermodesulforhabdus norvegica TaxID=39841 RepID=A0A1I4UR35_9BACT|nr:4-(cytidine 5'-diphospho)-2-C-methyl-D-erythritol kinase [Thermodesulforhabdus norvegica]SFM91467.1 4-diphosphocytidyl-2-C-methyl-D-erythritol kinase [Thermodesulforhabdus norvegica]